MENLLWHYCIVYQTPQSVECHRPPLYEERQNKKRHRPCRTMGGSHRGRQIREALSDGRCLFVDAFPGQDVKDDIDNDYEKKRNCREEDVGYFPFKRLHLAPAVQLWLRLWHQQTVRQMSMPTFSNPSVRSLNVFQSKLT